MRRGRSTASERDMTPWLALRRLLRMFARWMTSLRFRVRAGRFSLPGFLRLPWWKVGLALLAVYILTRKDLQFSLDMKSPLGQVHKDEKENSPGPSGVAPMDVARRGQPAAHRAAYPTVDALDDAAVRAYINRFVKVAIAEMDKYGIPASVKMAQGILESQAGKKSGVKRTHNHFGAPLSQGSYETAWQNWRAHSELLSNQYNRLFAYGRDYGKWSAGLQRAGYSPDPAYAQKLQQIIERYQLHTLDQR